MNRLTKALLCSIAILICGCGTSNPSSPRVNRHFHEASAATMVLQFASWEYTFMIRPRYEENGFLRQVRRDNLKAACDELNVRRDLAVVVVGTQYGTQDLSRLVPEWKALLSQAGFKRAVFLRSNAFNRLNGSQVIDDSILYSDAARADTAQAGTFR